MAVEISSLVCPTQIAKDESIFFANERDVNLLNGQEFKSFSIPQNAVIARGEQFSTRIGD
jgi:hypothetical protein